ncbi:MAG: bifunctional phosphoglucose/phosphomannose isomerase [Fimbriimonadaceae bacterium]
MHQLDDRDFVLRLDPKGMYQLTADFPNQCRRALEIGKAEPLEPLADWPDIVMLTGLGGSAAGGDFVRALIEHEGHVPFMVNRDYHLPKFVGAQSVVLACSYSGNTEETLSAYQDAQTRECHRAVVTSGGRLAEMADAEDHVPVFLIPGGQPPRTALGYMLIPVVVACQRWGFLPEQPYQPTFELLEKCVQDWGVETPFDANPAKQLAAALKGSVSVLYGLGSYQAVVANRWKGQINENAKNLTFANAFPELNHNEILGWVKAKDQGVGRWVAVILEDGRESAKMKERARVTTELISGVCEVHRVKARGESLLERMLSLTLFGDFVSLYLAALNDVDPENIDSINVLKKALAAVPG